MAAPSAVKSRFISPRIVYDACGRDFFPLLEDYFNSSSYIDKEEEDKPRVIAVVAIVADDSTLYGAVSSGVGEDGYNLGLALAAGAEQLLSDGVVPDVRP